MKNLKITLLLITCLCSCSGNSTVEPVMVAPTITDFIVSPRTITVGDETTLAWSVKGTEPVDLSISEVGEVTGFMASLKVKPTTTTTYTLTAQNVAGKSSRDVTVTVEAIPVEPEPNISESNYEGFTKTTLQYGNTEGLELFDTFGSASTSIRLDKIEETQGYEGTAEYKTLVDEGYSKEVIKCNPIDLQQENRMLDCQTVVTHREKYKIDMFLKGDISRFSYEGIFEAFLDDKLFASGTFELTNSNFFD